MKIKISGSNMDVGSSLSKYVEEHLPKAITKYFDKAVSAEVHFTKNNGYLFKTLIVVNDGIKGSITIKSDAEAGDVYSSFNEACNKAAKQLRRYKRRIKNYRRNGGGIKSVDLDYKDISAVKYVIPPVGYDLLEEIESEETAADLANQSANVINEKITSIEQLTVDEAIMKMDLANLPALVFINQESKRLNVVYQRKDGNISWIDPVNS
jgi:ribosomal subunit interface protein